MAKKPIYTHIILLTVVLNFITFCTGTLNTVQDDDLMNLIRSETHVIALFSTKDCPLCDNFENILTGLKEEFSDSLNAQVVKVINSQLTRLYSPTKEPALVFFRHGVPLLYTGQPNEELILHIFQDNQKPLVKELSDETFEHLTQAATGATTGDWFVMFYTTECVDCHRLQARLEAVAATLKSRLTVARMNKGVDGVATAKRFRANETPSFILFKQGKLYRYQIKKYDVASFIAFAQDWYKNMKPERIPLPKTPFDEYVERIADTLHSNPILWQICLVTTFLGCLLLVLIKYKRITMEKEKAQKKIQNKDKDK